MKSVETYDFLGNYVDDLESVIDIDAIKRSGIRIGADPLGGASVAYWAAIRDRYGLDVCVTNPEVDPTWSFMTLDWDGAIRMDPSSPSAMASVVARKDEFDIVTGNDADADRHGIVTRDGGLMNPNHFLAVAIDYLFRNRSSWPTDKDGILLALLASEIRAVTGKTPSERYRELTEQFGNPVYERVDEGANAAQKAALCALVPESITATHHETDPRKFGCTYNGFRVGLST